MNNLHNLTSAKINSYLPDENAICACESQYDLKIKNKFVPHGIIGGDLWGIRPLNDNEVAIYLFDFLGHGESAGKEAAFLYSIMTDMFEPNVNPGEFINHLNERFCNSPGFERYATMFLGVYNKEKRILNYSSAAHQPFFHLSLDSDKPVNIVKPSCILGAKDDALYETYNLNIQKNELLLTYSDALPEARHHKNGALFDEELQQTIYDEHKKMKNNGRLCANSLFKNVLKQFGDSCKSKTEDDLTFLVFQTG